MVCATGALEAPCLPVVATPTTAGRALVFPSRQTINNPKSKIMTDATRSVDGAGVEPAVAVFR